MTVGTPVLKLITVTLTSSLLASIPAAAAAQQFMEGNSMSGSDAATAEQVTDRPAPAGTSKEDSPRYTVHFVGLHSEELEKRVKQLSSLWENRRERADSLAQIRRRISQDTDTITQLLQAEGYFAAQISAQSDASTTDADDTLTVTITVVPGPLYEVESVEVDAPQEALAMVHEILELKPGMPATTQSILDAEARLRLELPQRGYPFSKIGERRVVVDHNSRTVRYALPADPGPKAKFGEIVFTGSAVLTSKHIKQLARFKPGQTFDQRKVDDFREAILETGLFSEASIEPYPDPDSPPDAAEVTAPIRVKLEQAKIRTIGVSLGYGTGSGAKGEVMWQHRNLFGHEERLTLLGRLGTEEQLARADLQRFNFRRRDQSLLGRAVMAHETPDAYETYRFEIGAGIERETGPKWQKRWVYSLRAETEISRIRDALGERTYLLLSAPMSARFDGSDNLFDPTQGLRASGLISPELSEQSGVFSYVRTDFGASYYMPLDKDRDFVVAARGRLGMIWGADRDRIAATRRFFAGGGGSIRGFGYQEVGPKDANGKPLGGKSLVETSLELRWRISRTIGIVPFIDAGNTHESSTPSLSNYRWGAGIGLRYFTDFAPIRVDIATPLDREPGEKRVLFYVSIGQSF